MWEQHITFNENILRGKPIIRGTRLSVDFILELMANEWTIESIIGNYPQLSKADISACLEYASSIIKQETVLMI